MMWRLRNSRKAVVANDDEKAVGRLSVDRLSSGYGDLTVVSEVSLTVEPGEIVALLGANGAGKTTLLLTISGELAAKSGQVSLDGSRLTGLGPDRVLRRGLAHVLQGRQIFAHLTVGENLRIARARRQGNREAALEVVFEQFPILRDKLDEPAGSLSGGQQQMLVICRAIMSGPRVLLLDEPSIGLAPIVLESVSEVVHWLRDTVGMSVLLVEQQTSFALSLASRCYVMASGRIQREASAEELSNDPDLMATLLGRPGSEQVKTD